MLILADILAATGGKVLATGPEEFSGVSIDSRSIADGELFFALRGENHDGHAYLSSALQKGGGAVVSADHDLSHLAAAGANRTIIAVSDPLKALQAAAAYRRKRFQGTVIGIVGSNGKTTTKELAAAVLETKYVVHKTTGNLNNHIGLPLSLLRAPERAEVLVMEMGTNRPGDVRELCEIAQPTVGVVTNIGMEHLQGFGTLEGVRDAELELLPYIRTVVVNGDDDFLMAGVKERFQGKIITFGINSPHASVRGLDCTPNAQGTRFLLETATGRIPVDLRLFGMFNVANALAAAAVGAEAGVPLEGIRAGIGAFSGVAMRFSVRRQDGITWLADMYNANPSSMEVSVDELLRFCGEGKRAVAVLGDMLELGDRAGELHEELGRRLARQGVGLFIGVGPLMKAAVAAFGTGACAADDAAQAAELLRQRLLPEDVVLVKGSRGMRMERVCEALGVGLT